VKLFGRAKQVLAPRQSRLRGIEAVSWTQARGTRAKSASAREAGAKKTEKKKEGKVRRQQERGRNNVRFPFFPPWRKPRSSWPPPPLQENLCKVARPCRGYLPPDNNPWTHPGQILAALQRTRSKQAQTSRSRSVDARRARPAAPGEPFAQTGPWRDCSRGKRRGVQQAIQLSGSCVAKKCPKGPLRGPSKRRRRNLGRQRTDQWRRQNYGTGGRRRQRAARSERNKTDSPTGASLDEGANGGGDKKPRLEWIAKGPRKTCSSRRIPGSSGQTAGISAARPPSSIAGNGHARQGPAIIVQERAIRRGSVSISRIG